MNMAAVSKEPLPDDTGTPKPTRRIAGISIMSVFTSFAKKITTVGIIYLLGYFEFSVAWLIGPVILSVIRDEWKKEKELKRTIAKAAALCSEKEIILARVDDLPSWVFFPDIERAEWVNKILRQVWPNANHYAKGLIKETIEPAIRDSLAAYKLNGFQFQKMILGSIPPRVGGVKVYDRNVSRNEIIMDLDIFYAGDCDISFTLGGVSGGIKDFQIHGMVRVVMKPLINVMPMVGGLQIFFLNNPTIDFNLVGVADLLDMPGLSDLLRRIIVEQVATMMVLPNKLPILLSDAIPSTVLKTPEPEGVLRVHIVEAKNLMKKDIGMLGKGKSDPYAIITVGAQEFRTKTIDNTVNPKWDYWCEAVVATKNRQEIALSVWDWDPGFPGVQNDDFLGRATIEIKSVVRKREVDVWITLEAAKHGMVHLRMTWFTLSSCLEDLQAAIKETQLLRVTSMSTAILMVFVDSLKNLPNARPQSKPDPFITITLCKKTETTAVQWRTDNPVYEQGYTFLVPNPEADTMHIKVTDNKTGKEIGEFTYNVSMLLEKPNLEVEQPFALKRSGGDSKIVLSMQLRILKFERPSLDSQASIDSMDGTENTTELSPPDSPTSKVGSNLPKQDSFVRLEKQESVRSTKSFTNDKLGLEESFIKSESEVVESEPNLIQRTGSVRSTTGSLLNEKGESGLGRIQLSFNYSVPRQRLEVTIHRIVNLPLEDPSNIPDPYVKIYLLPERNKDTKRKTEAVKDNCNPIYNQVFEYVISLPDLRSRQLEVSVATKKGLFSSQSNVMGQVLVNLSEIELNQVGYWFDLLPEFQKYKDEYRHGVFTLLRYRSNNKPRS